jgi:UPF0716 protein FxsA
MLGRLLLLFLLTPAIELGLLIQVDSLIGFPATIGLIVATGIVGSYLARREGVNTWRRLNERLNRGDLPGKELIDGVIILVAGALLVTPGVLTDAVGFLGLLPPTRALIRRLLMRRLKSKVEEGSLQMQFGFFGGAAPGPNGDGASSPDAPPSANGHARPNDPNQRWEGSGRQIPRHADGDSSDDSTKQS